MVRWIWEFFYQKEGNKELLAYTDSDYAGYVDDRKSTSGYVFLLSEGAISWSLKKQPVVTLSTTEAEFVASTSCACQGVWMRRVLEKLGNSQGKCTTVLCDNSSTIKLSKNPVMHGRSKHIDVRFHFLRDLTRNGVVVGVIIFGSVWFLSKKVTKPNFFFEKKNRNRVKPTGFGSVRFGFLGQKPVQTGLARFFRFWLGFLGFFRFGSVWLGFFPVFCRFRFGFSVFCL